jgi:hypothetical protein
MSRHGYHEDHDQQDLAMYRGWVASAIRGKRGQKLLRDLRDALDAMPEKRLVQGRLQTEQGCCALGAVAGHRGVDLTELDPDPELFDIDTERVNLRLSWLLDIATVLVAETEYENDEFHGTPEQRWSYMRAWAERHILEAAG